MVSGSNSYAVAALSFKVRAGSYAQAVAADVKRGIVCITCARNQRVGKGIARINIGSAQRTNHTIGRYVLSDRTCTQRNICWYFVHIRYRDGKCFLEE